MHVGQFVRGKGKFFVTEYVPTHRARDAPVPAAPDDGPRPDPVQRRRADAADAERGVARRGRLEIHPHDAEVRGIKEGDWVGLASRAGEIVLRADVTERVRPGVVYTTFHFPESGANVVTTENSDWATNCPEYKVTAVEVVQVDQPRVAAALSRICRATGDSRSRCACRDTCRDYDVRSR